MALLLLVLAALPSPAPAASRPAAPAWTAGAPASADAVRALRTWLERARRFRASGGDEERLEELERLLDDVRLQRIARPETAAACDLALLLTAAFGWVPGPEREALRERMGSGSVEVAFEPRVSLAGFARLEERLAGPDGDEVARRLAADVLARPGDHAPEALRAACDLLAGRRAEGLQAALLAQTVSDDELLREAAFRALCGWSEPAVDRAFVDALVERRVALALALEHLVPARDGLRPEAERELHELARIRLGSPDWRDVVRGVRLSAALRPERAAPLLVDALATATRRIDEGAGSPRARHDVLRALHRISGRSIGPEPDRWRLWWSAVREGRIPLAGEPGEPGAVTRAGFFGLSPVTDRVIFVIDRSRSMRHGFGPDASRWEAAVGELLRFAGELGPDGRFNVVLFHTDTESFRPRLVAATAGELEAARRWLARQDPDGGTALAAGVRAALGLGRGDRIDPAEVEADTVVVLCDGQTAEGPSWVRPWLLRANAEAELVFHCVQIGSAGDGTLERLARESGGEFVRVP